MTDQVRLYTLEEFEKLLALPENVDRRLELINGEIIEKGMPTQEHAWVAANIGAPLHIHLKTHRLGTDGPEVRYRIPNDPHHSLIPDWSFILGMEAPLVIEGSVRRMPDWALEVQSPDDELADLRKKVKTYLRNGTRLVWLALPRQRVIEVYWAEGGEYVYGADQVIDFGDLLLGLTMTVRDIFDR